MLGPVHRTERRVPGGSLLGGVAGWLGADGLGVMAPAVQLLVGANVRCSLLPVEAVQRLAGHRSQCVHGPRRSMLGRELADAGLTLVHRPAQLGEVSLQVRVADPGYAPKP